MATTVSVYALPLGGIPGPARIFPDVLQKAARVLKEAEGSLLTDSLVTHVADWLVLVMVHQQGGSSPVIHALKDAAVAEASAVADARRLFRRDVQPVQIGLSFGERECEPLVLFLASSDAEKFWNPALMRAFADPFSTQSLPSGSGFVFCLEDACAFSVPMDLYKLIAAAEDARILGVALDVERPAAAAAPGVVMIARTEAPFPTLAEMCDAVACSGPVCPVSLCDAAAVRPGVIPVVALGFSVADGKLSGPVDLYDNPAYAAVRFAAGNR